MPDNIFCRKLDDEQFLFEEFSVLIHGLRLENQNKCLNNC